MKVFIADDSSALRERLASMLLDMQDEDIEIVGQAQDVQGAIEAIRRTKPEVVILDIRMPGGSGIDVLQSIKKIAPSPVIIMLTNYPYPQYRKKCMDAGADFFFDKSNEFVRIPEVLRQLGSGEKEGLTGSVR